MTEEIFIDQMHKWENVWSTIKQLSKEEIAKIPKEFLRTSKIPEHKVRIKKWEKSEEIVDNFDDDLSNIMLYDVDVVMENSEESTSLNSSNNDITQIDQEKAAELMATPAAETSMDSSDNGSQTNESTISNTVNNSMVNLNSLNSVSSDISSEKLEPSINNGSSLTNGSSMTNGSNLRFEILPDNEISSDEKLPLKKTSNNNEKGSEHSDKKMKLDDGNVKEINISNKIETKGEEKVNTDNNKVVSDTSSLHKRKADEMDNNSLTNESKPTSPIKSTLSNSNKDKYEKQHDEENKKDLSDIVKSPIKEAKSPIKESTIEKENELTKKGANDEVHVKDITELEKKHEPETKLNINCSKQRSSLFDNQGYIILKPSLSPIKSAELKKIEVSVPASNNNLMEIDIVEKSDKFDAEQSNTDSTFGLKSYNSAELTTEDSYKKIVESIEDSNISSISEVSSFNNEDSLDQSSSVSSIKVKRIIDRLENNTIHNNDHLLDVNKMKSEKQEEFKKPSIDEKSPEVIEESKDDYKEDMKNEIETEKKENVNQNIKSSDDKMDIDDNKEEVKKVIVENNKEEEVKETTDNKNKEKIETTIIDNNKKEELKEAIINNDKMEEIKETVNNENNNEEEKSLENNLRNIDNNDNKIDSIAKKSPITTLNNNIIIDKKVEVIAKTDENVNSVKEKKETTIMDDDKSKKKTINSISEKIKLFENNANSNENIEINRKNGEAKLQEIKKINEKENGEKEAKSKLNVEPSKIESNQGVNKNETSTISTTIEEETKALLDVKSTETPSVNEILSKDKSLETTDNNNK